MEEATCLTSLKPATKKERCDLLSKLILLGSCIFLVWALWFNGAFRVPDSILTPRASTVMNESLEQLVEREVRVMCLVLTMPKNHKTKAVHVRHTWGKRCNRLLFISTDTDDEFDTVTVPMEEIYYRTWSKIRVALAHAYQHYRDEMDWFIKVDDDSYLLLENLRYALYPYSADMPIFFGYNFHLLQQRNLSFMSGGSGYVLSREALRRFVQLALPDDEKCKPTDKLCAEDVEVAVCLQNVGVVAGDSRDLLKKYRFCPFEPHYFLSGNYLQHLDWFHKYSYYFIRLCRNCLSKYAAAFHYITPEDFYLYDYLTYQFELANDGEKRQSLQETEFNLPKKLKWEDVQIPPADNHLAEIKKETR